MSEVEAPRQLPMRPPWFVDRRVDIAEFGDAVRAAKAEGRPLLRVVTGPEGIGKTTFAIMACYEVAEEFPDAQLYYDLCGSEAGSEVSVEDVAGSFLGQLGLGIDEIPSRPADRFAMLRSRLAGRKALVLLDDVARADQVVPLLFESPTAAVVVTTRRPLVALRQHGFASTTMQRFGDADAQELFSVIAGEQLDGLRPDVLRRMREICEGLPLALSIAASHLSAADESPDDYLAELLAASPHEVLAIDGDRPVLRIFETTFQELSADEARAYTLLSVLPGPHFGHGVAAEVLGTDEAGVVRLLRELTRRFVLERIGDKRYRFHGLVRAHARDRAFATYSQTEIASVVNASRWWYLRRQVALDQVLSSRPFPLGADEHYRAIERAYHGHDAERRAWEETGLEWPNLLAAMAAGGDQPQDGLTAVFPLTLWFFAYQTRRCAELIDAYRRALDCYSSSPEAWQLYRDLAGLHERCGEPDAADKYVTLALQTGYEPGIASVHEWHGLIRESRGDLRGALESLARAMDAVPLMRNAQQEERARALLHMHTGRVRSSLGECESAAISLAVASDYFADHGEPVNQARADLDLGRALAGADRNGEATLRLEAVYLLFRERGLSDKAAEAADELAGIANAEGRHDDAGTWRAAARELRGQD